MTKIALISVSNKEGVVDFALGLEKLGFEIISTGGTFAALQAGGVKKLTEVSTLTDFPEGLEGRIKTLHPKVFGGVLCLRDRDTHLSFCQENNLPLIDLVVVNLYPFKTVYDNPESDFGQKVENIDIGGPSMIRAAAKNYKYCAPVVDTADYDRILQQYTQNEDLDMELREDLATKVFEYTAHYDLWVAKCWAEKTKITEAKGQLRYGENPHQSAVLLSDPFAQGPLLAGAEILNGKPLSYNNFGDATGALELALSFAQADDLAFATIIKHATPCGAATGETISEAFTKAYQADTLSAFGGVIALNRTCDRQTAEQIVAFFNEIVLAPDYDDEALKILRTKVNLRVLRIPNFSQGQTADMVIKKIRGGTLIQEADTQKLDFSLCSVPTEIQPTAAQLEDMQVAWKIVKIIKSNAIAVVKDGVLLGKGGGQTSRVEAMASALAHAKDLAKGAVLASDAFFPFADAVELAGEAGVAAIVQPGGAKGDQEILTKANELKMAMLMTGRRAFLH